MKNFNNYDETLPALLMAASREMPNALPAQYFEEFNKRLEIKIFLAQSFDTAQEELNFISPALAKYAKKNPYANPSFQHKIADKQPEQIHFSKTFSLQNISKFLAAACVLGFIFWSVLNNQNYNKNLDFDTAVQLVEDAEILSFIDVQAYNEIEEINYLNYTSTTN